MLIIFSGLPGSGKSTIARALARRLRAVYLRIDTIEQAIRAAEQADNEMGPSVISSPMGWLERTWHLARSSSRIPLTPSS